jgi:hypothetical protein
MNFREFVENFSDEEIQRANRSWRNWHHVSSQHPAKIIGHVLDTLGDNKNAKVLDYGAGKAALHTQFLRDKGYSVDAHEFGNNVVPGLHEPGALNKQYDVVFASNVLNVQSSLQMLQKTLDQIAAATSDQGCAIVNYPLDPRYGGFPAKVVKAELESRFQTVEILEKKLGPVFRCSRPIRQKTSAISTSHATMNVPHHGILPF